MLLKKPIFQPIKDLIKTAIPIQLWAVLLRISIYILAQKTTRKVRRTVELKHDKPTYSILKIK